MKVATLGVSGALRSVLGVAEPRTHRGLLASSASNQACPRLGSWRLGGVSWGWRERETGGLQDVELVEDGVVVVGVGEDDLVFVLGLGEVLI